MVAPDRPFYQVQPSLYSKTLKWGKLARETGQVVKGNEPLVQLFLKSVLIQVASEVMLGNQDKQSFW